MYAIIQDGGKQYKVVPGQTVDLEMKEDCIPGNIIELDKVVFFNDSTDIRVGSPYLEDVKVKAMVEKNVSGEKLVVFKFRCRKDSRKKRGHRQHYTRVRVQQIVKE